MSFALALGDGAAEALRAAGQSGVGAFRDELSFGPLGDLSDAEGVSAARARWWTDVLEGRPWRGGPGAAPPDPQAAMRADLDLLAEAFGPGDPVQVWAGESLQDLMFLAGCASFGGPDARLVLRRPGAGGAPPSSGLAVQPPERLRRPAPPRALDAQETAGLRAFWQALIAPDVAPLRAFAEAAPGAPSGLAAAARARLARLPHPVTGFDSVEARVLARLGPAPRPVAQALGEALAQGAAGPDLVGDLSMFHALRALADPALPRPLARLTGDGAIRGSQAALTPFGRDALAGRADRVAANGWRARLGGLALDAAPGAAVPRAPGP